MVIGVMRGYVCIIYGAYHTTKTADNQLLQLGQRFTIISNRTQSGSEL